MGAVPLSGLSRRVLGAPPLTYLPQGVLFRKTVDYQAAEMGARKDEVLEPALIRRRRTKGWGSLAERFVHTHAGHRWYRSSGEGPDRAWVQVEDTRFIGGTP